MKKILSVFLAALMLCSMCSVLAFGAAKYPAPDAPANLALTEDGVASWDAVAVPADAEPDVECAISYKVTLYTWDFDDKIENWTYTQAGDEIITSETTVDLSANMVSGKYIFAVAAIAEYTVTLSSGKVTHIKRFSDKAELDRANAVVVTKDIFAEPVDTSIPFESLVDENDAQASGILKILKKIKEVFTLILRFLGYAGDVTGITEDIRNKK